MNRVNKTIINIILIVILLIIYLALSGLRLTPVQAHKASERSIHYGPSEIVKIFDYGDYQHLLCKYDKWVSCNTVQRQFFFFWSAGSQTTGFENDVNKPIDYSYQFSNKIAMVYGVVNDDRITKVELYTEDGKSYVQEELYDDLFYFTWEFIDWEEIRMEKIVGYDKNGDIVAEVKYGD